MSGDQICIKNDLKAEEIPFIGGKGLTGGRALHTPRTQMLAATVGPKQTDSTATGHADTGRGCASVAQCVKTHRCLAQRRVQSLDSRHLPPPIVPAPSLPACAPAAEH